MDEPNGPAIVVPCGGAQHRIYYDDRDRLVFADHPDWRRDLALAKLGGTAGGCVSFLLLYRDAMGTTAPINSWVGSPWQATDITPYRTGDIQRWNNHIDRAHSRSRRGLTNIYCDTHSDIFPLDSEHHASWLGRPSKLKMKFIESPDAVEAARRMRLLCLYRCSYNFRTDVRFRFYLGNNFNRYRHNLRDCAEFFLTLDPGNWLANHPRMRDAVVVDEWGFRHLTFGAKGLFVPRTYLPVASAMKQRPPRPR
jgi:hypothetical protein